MHERYEEMCAVATLGELPEAEFSELQEHLAICDSCRQLYREFCQISANYLGSLGAERLSSPIKADHDLYPENLLARCLAKSALKERPPTVRTGISRNWQCQNLWRLLFIRRKSLVYSFGCLCLVFIAVLLGFRISQHRLQNQISDLRARLQRNAITNANSLPVPVGPGDRLAAQDDKLAQELREISGSNARLSKDKRELEEELVSARTRLQELTAEFQSHQERDLLENAARNDLETSLLKTQEQLSNQEQTVAELEDKLRQKEKELADLTASRSPSVSDDEAKRLFGARDLHIVDVYDVDGRGKTRQSFGRVYYVEKKLLLFYAFDLEDRKHNRTAAAFQAWGYKEANAGAPQNLGLFYVDDASLNQWVLKVNNPKVLEHIDVVFVTLEPPQGSPSPKGRRLLYANLAGAPNHP